MRRLIGITFLVLAAYVTVQAVYALTTQSRPGESLVGIVLAAASLIIMPLLAWGKLRVARGLGSEALRAEDLEETLACAYLSFTLLLGLLLNATLGWWWADPAVALLMVPWLIREGLEGWRGEGDERLRAMDPPRLRLG